MKYTLLFLLLCTKVSLSQPFKFHSQDISPKVNFRGLSVVDDSVVWISGAQGHVGLSTDGAKTWKISQVAGFEKTDFRTLYAFDAKKAVIANAGSPASILITTDGGIHWHTTYRNNDTAAFFDGIDFWNDKEGIIYGDPIDGKMLILTTHDGGFTWNMNTDSCRPRLREGEASFAASGTGINCMEDDQVIISTGGAVTRLLVSEDKGQTWDTIQTPVIAGKNSTGIFSFDCRGSKNIVVVGGDYLIDSFKVNHVFYSKNGGKSWHFPETPTRGYRECVTYISRKNLIAIGPSGAEYSEDGGKNWIVLTNEKTFHTLRKARNGKLLVASGKGKVGWILR